jgi:hypothetical protein
MATLNLRRFTKYETLTAIRPTHLLRLLEPYQDFIISRGVPWRSADCAAADFPYAQIAQVLMTPDAAMPTELTEALYVIHEMASPAGHEAMIEALNQGMIGLDLPENATALDLAIQIDVKKGKRGLLRPVTAMFDDKREQGGIEGGEQDVFQEAVNNRQTDPAVEMLAERFRDLDQALNDSHQQIHTPGVIVADTRERRRVGAAAGGHQGSAGGRQN